MEPNFIDDGHCDVFIIINESEIRLKERIEKWEASKKFQVFNKKYDDTMQYIMKTLHEGWNGDPIIKILQFKHFFVSLMRFISWC
jgi:hypothetical protein